MFVSNKLKKLEQFVFCINPHQHTWGPYGPRSTLKMSYEVGEAPRDFLFFVIVNNLVKSDTARDGKYSFIGFSVKNYQVFEKRWGPNGPQNFRVGCWLHRI